MLGSGPRSERRCHACRLGHFRGDRSAGTCDAGKCGVIRHGKPAPGAHGMDGNEMGMGTVCEAEDLNETSPSVGANEKP